MCDTYGKLWCLFFLKYFYFIKSFKQGIALGFIFLAKTLREAMAHGRQGSFLSAPARNWGGAHGAAVAFGTHRGGSATGHQRCSSQTVVPMAMVHWPRPGSLRRRVGGGLWLEVFLRFVRRLLGRLFVLSLRVLKISYFALTWSEVQWFQVADADIFMWCLNDCVSDQA